MRQGDKRQCYYANFGVITDEWGEEHKGYELPIFAEKLFIAPLTGFSDITQYGTKVDITKRIADDCGALKNIKLKAGIWVDREPTVEDGLIVDKPDYTVIAPPKAFGKLIVVDIEENQ